MVGASGTSAIDAEDDEQDVDWVDDPSSRFKSDLSNSVYIHFSNGKKLALFRGFFFKNNKIKLPVIDSEKRNTGVESGVDDFCESVVLPNDNSPLEPALCYQKKKKLRS